MAESLFRSEKFEQAQSLFDQLDSNQNQLSQLKPNLIPWIALRRSQCLAHGQQYKMALQLANESKQRYPKFDAMYEFDFVRGKMLAREGLLKDAITAFELVTQHPRGRKTETSAMAQWQIGAVSYTHLTLPTKA